ncbi:MAG: sulfotransferase domain-containing protein [Gammaproteobacteria bacterium]|nr:sulfotransferase domain-containing protein [Gammaproteobacteria bacterium]
MLINDDFAFIHFPKTAGKSLTKYFIAAWDDPIYGRVSPGQVQELADVMRPGITLEVDRGHENIRRTSIIMREQGRRIEDLRAIFVCIRNPYDMAVSTYFFMRETYVQNAKSPRFKMAAELSFEEFWKNDISKTPPERWLTLNGRILENQRFIRFESLREDLALLALEFDFREAELPHLNQSRRGHYSEYMTPAAERAIYTRFEYMFEVGYYRRESFD